MIGLDDNGNFLVDSNGRLLPSPNPPLQNFKSEVRCIQQTYAIDETYGRNVLVWTLGQSVSDRISDLYRIGLKYMPVQTVTYSEQNKKYEIQT
jgi:hypothetical protein